MTDALVLSGGEIKIFYQAGVILGLSEQGFKPDIVTGISAGALNAGWIAAHHQMDPKLPAQGLVNFLLNSINGPNDVVKKRHWYELAYRFAFNKWAGLVDSAPWEKMARSAIGPKVPVTDPTIRVQVGVVNMESGDIQYHDCQSPDFMDAVLASAAAPFAMPMRRLRGAWCYDGGVRDIAPLGQAIKMGASRAVAVLCQAPGISHWKAENAGHAISEAMRLVEILTNETLENDIRQTQRINAMIRTTRRTVMQVEGRDYYHVPVLTVRPSVAFNVDATDFTKDDRIKMVDAGYADGKAARLENAA